jgi:adenine-specific DNA-methyltransferase
MPEALAKIVNDLRCETVMISYNNESWLSREELLDIASAKGHVEILDFDFKRYVGSQIGVYNKAGEKVGLPAHKNNIEHIVIAGDRPTVRRMVSQLDGA